jgi:integrase
MFRREDGMPWCKSYQQQRMEDTPKAAGSSGHVRFHDRRHTFATLLAMNGTALALIAHQLGHNGMHMVENRLALKSASQARSWSQKLARRET